MDIRNAMAIIADLQARLLVAGFQAGTYGPRGDGIDGRYGQATRDALVSYATRAGLVGLNGNYPSSPAMESLGYAKEDVFAMQQAIDTWNQWRAANYCPPREGCTYEAQATQYLCEAVPELCVPPEELPGPGDGNGNGLVPNGEAPPAGKTSGGIPTWVWVLGAVLLTAAAAVGVYVIWRKRKSMPKRKRKSLPALPAHAGPSMAGYGQAETPADGFGGFSFEAGPEITPVEMGQAEQDESDGDDDTEGYS